MISHPVARNVLAVGLSLLLGSAVFAQAETEPSGLALRRVALHSSGLGWFHYEGSVGGKDAFELAIREDEVSDVLRTLHIRDASGRSYATMDAGADPIDIQPPSLDMATLGGLLLSMKGQAVILHTRLKEQFEGRVVAVEMEWDPSDAQVIERERVTLLTSEGLQSFLLKDVQRIKPLDEGLEQRLHAALSQANEPVSYRNLVVRFEGEEPREVAVSVLRPVPMWKSAYIATDASLQLRAIVENTTDQDWEEIALTLVDGNPITFQMELGSVVRAQRQQVARPHSQPELAPRFDEAEWDDEAVTGLGGGGFGGGMGGFGGGMGGFGGGMGGMGMGMGGMGMADPFADNSGGGGSGAAEQANVDDLFSNYDARQPTLAVQPNTRLDAGNAGASVLIDFPKVTIPAGKSAILSAAPLKVLTETLTVYSESYHPTTPLRSLRLKNESPYRLPAGPVSVFLHQTGFAGEAVLPLLSADATRLVGFAVDDGVRVKHEAVTSERELISLTIEPTKRWITATYQTHVADNYLVKNQSGAVREVLIDHPRSAKWETEPHDLEIERTEQSVRLQAKIADGEQVGLVVKSSRTEVSPSGFLDVSVERLRDWIGEDAGVLSDAQRTTLQEILETRTALRVAEQQRASNEQAWKNVLAEITRLTKQLSASEKFSQKARDLYENQLLEQEAVRESLVQQNQELDQEIERLKGLIMPPARLTTPAAQPASK